MVAYSGPLGNAPTLANSLSASPTAGTWILSSMSVGLAVSLLTAGALADDFGRRTLFAFGAWVFAAGSVLCAIANGPTLYILGRLVAGVGAAGVIATGLGLAIAAATNAARQASVARWWGVSMGAGIALGPLLTGLLDLGGLWRTFYWLLMALGAVIAITATRVFAESIPLSARRVDVAGVITMTGGLSLVLVALVEARQGRPGVTLACGVAGALFLVAFVVSQVRGRTPMLPRSLFRRADFVAAVTAGLTTGVGVIALMSFACTFLVTGMGMTTLAAGVLLTAWSATSAASAMLSKRMPDRFAGPGQLIIGLVGVSIGMLLLTALDVTSTPWRLVPGLLVAGVATGILNAGLGRQAVASVPPERAALGTGTNNTARYVGSSIGVTIVSVVAVNRSEVTADLVAGWNQVAVLTAGLSLVGAVVVAVLTRSAAKSPHHDGDSGTNSFSTTISMTPETSPYQEPRDSGCLSP